MMRRGWLFYIMLAIVGPTIITATFASAIVVFGLAELASEMRVEAQGPPAILRPSPHPKAQKPPLRVAKADFR